MTTNDLPQAHACSCGANRSELPELDARLIPHEVRHAAIMGAVDSLANGQAIALIAPHDPVPLLEQLRAKYGDHLTVEYLERGPEWKLKLCRC